MRHSVNLLLICAVALLASCAASGPVITGTQRAPLTPAEVVIYSAQPPEFEQIAVLSASSKSVFTTGGQKSIDKVVERLKEQAAKLGANGLILEDFTDQIAGSIGTGVGSDSYSHSGSVSVGVGGAVGIFKKTGKGRAIYVPPYAQPITR
jgi:hypothetical protein